MFSSSPLRRLRELDLSWDAVVGSPPCQRVSRQRRAVGASSWDPGPRDRDAGRLSPMLHGQKRRLAWDWGLRAVRLRRQAGWSSWRRAEAALLSWMVLKRHGAEGVGAVATIWTVRVELVPDVGVEVRLARMERGRREAGGAAQMPASAQGDGRRGQAGGSRGQPKLRVATVYRKQRRRRLRLRHLAIGSVAARVQGPAASPCNTLSSTTRSLPKPAARYAGLGLPAQTGLADRS